MQAPRNHQMQHQPHQPGVPDDGCLSLGWKPGVPADRSSFVERKVARDTNGDTLSDAAQSFDRAAFDTCKWRIDRA